MKKRKGIRDEKINHNRDILAYRNVVHELITRFADYILSLVQVNEVQKTFPGYTNSLGIMTRGKGEVRLVRLKQILCILLFISIGIDAVSQAKCLTDKGKQHSLIIARAVILEKK